MVRNVSTRSGGCHKVRLTLVCAAHSCRAGILAVIAAYRAEFVQNGAFACLPATPVVPVSPSSRRVVLVSPCQITLVVSATFNLGQQSLLATMFGNFYLESIRSDYLFYTRKNFSYSAVMPIRNISFHRPALFSKPIPYSKRLLPW